MTDASATPHEENLLVQAFGVLLLIGFFFGTMTFTSLAFLHGAIRLEHSGHTVPVVVAEGRDVVAVGGPHVYEAKKATVIGRTEEFPADQVYATGDHAFLTYSKSLHYGVVTAAPPRTVFGIVHADGDADFTMSMGLIGVFALIISNACVIIFLAFRHIFGPYVRDRLAAATGGFDKTLIIGITLLQALVAGTLAIVPLAAAFDAFSFSVRMDSDSLWTIYATYGLLLLFIGSHAPAGAAYGLLWFFRSAVGQNLKEIVGYLASFALSIHVVSKMFELTLSDKILNLSNWWDIAKEFGRVLFS
jgi:hypothetical protein